VAIPNNFRRIHLEQALTAKQLRIIVIIRIGFMLGISFYYLIVLLLYSMFIPAGFSTQDTSLMVVLSVAHVVFTLVSTAMAFYLSSLQLRPERLTEKSDIQTPEDTTLYAVGLYRVSSVLLMAPIEGASFFGAVICMIGVENGTIEFYPMYWLNAASAVLLILVGILTFPTRNRILDKLESAFVQQ
jgi:peptidoglycan/LPS O-acetylase OafA/YrhL